jgi:16S rRNA (guanine527-N7)-methyltransferase
VELSRISALLEPFLDRPLEPAQLDQISMYIDLLLRWNARINLTAVRDPESIVTRHFGESFFLARHLLPAPGDLDTVRTRDRGPQTARVSRTGVVDIGSGAGFPALPLKIWAPGIALTMIESNHKKAAFLREVSRALTLTDINVIAERAEALVGRLPAAEVVTLRAVESFQSIVPIATRVLAPTGRLAFLIGAAQFPTLAHLTPVLSWQSPIPVPCSQSRVIAISIPGT